MSLEIESGWADLVDLIMRADTSEWPPIHPKGMAKGARCLSFPLPPPAQKYPYSDSGPVYFPRPPSHVEKFSARGHFLHAEDVPSAPGSSRELPMLQTDIFTPELKLVQNLSIWGGWYQNRPHVWGGHFGVPEKNKTYVF